MSTLITRLDSRHQAFLRDQSPLVGQAESISSPANEIEVCQIIADQSRQRVPITIQGARSGLCGGAVPTGGHIVNLGRMTSISGIEALGEAHYAMEVQAGLSLEKLKPILQSRQLATTGWSEPEKQAFSLFATQPPFFWPVEPTEQTATVGGIVASNSRGPTAYLYGSAHHHIHAIRVVDSAGLAWKIKRGQHCFHQGSCLHPNGTRLVLPPLSSGTVAEPDLLDLYLGSEGVLGPITSVTIALSPLPAERWAIICFFQLERQAAVFLDALRRDELRGRQATIAALEFFDAETLKNIQLLLGRSQRTATLPEPPPRTQAAAYIELHGSDAEKVEDLAAKILAISEQCQVNPDHCLAFVGEGELARARLLCHSAIEAIYTGRKEGGTAPPIMGFEPVLAKTGWTFSGLLDTYRKDLEEVGLRAAIFGHAGELRVPVVLFPENKEETAAGQALLESWAERMLAAGGEIGAGYGVGKLAAMLGDARFLPHSFEVLHQLKQQLDPNGVFNQGNLLGRIVP